MSRLVRILSIDGGGIRGIIPAQVLLKLEEILQEKTGNPNARVTDYFDFFSGTSTGGILTCLYLCPDESNSGVPRYSAKDAVDFYVKYGPKIFKKSAWHKILSIFGLIRAKYSPKNIEKILQERFGEAQLSQLLKPCLITSYNIEARYEHFFTRQDAKSNPDYDFHIKDVARSTSAAPTYFPPARAKSIAINFFPLVDGGLFANNPALCAYTEVCRENKDISASDIAILSLGTGDDNKPIDYKKAQKWGALNWVVPVIDVLMSAGPETVNTQLYTIYKSINKSEQYLRIQPDIPDEMTAMDDASRENILALVEKGQGTALEYEDQLKDFADKLIESSKENAECLIL